MVLVCCPCKWLTVLVANTRKEGIARFSEASTDAEFAKIRGPRESLTPSSRELAGLEDSQFLAATAKVDKRSTINVTANIAVTTAAALNAERAAQRLKKALMNARKEPLLNKQAAEAVAAYEFKILPKLISPST